MFRNGGFIFLLVSLMVGCSTNTYSQAIDTSVILKKLTDLYGNIQKKNGDSKSQIEVLNYTKSHAEEDIKDASEKNLPAAEKRALKQKLKSINAQIDSLDNQFVVTSAQLKELSDLIDDDFDKQKRYITRYEKKNGTIKLPDGSEYESVLRAVVKNDDPSNRPPPLFRLEKEENSATGSTGSDSSNNKKNASKSNPKVRRSKDIRVTSKAVEQVKLEYADYNSLNDVMVSPPSGTCTMAFNGVDNFTGKVKKEIAPQVLFSFTEDFMRAQFKDKDFVTCYVGASRVQGGFYFLTLRFEIASKEAQRSFGFLDRGIPFSFKLLNGRNINLPNIKTDVGLVNTVKGTTTYTATFQLYSNDVKNLTSAELDQVRVAWSAGIDDYEIYDINALRHIFACLDN